MIAFCPLDLPKVDVDEYLINSLVDQYNTGHHDGIWDALPLRGRLTDQSEFRDAAAFERAWEKRYLDRGEVIDNIVVKSKLQPIFDQLDRLPIIVTHAQILRANKDVPKHHDMKHIKGNFIIDETPFEPNGWKILLNKNDQKSFYVCSSWSADPSYIKLPKETNTFVINEKHYPHGSSFVADKCMVSIFGLVDQQRANQLIDRSINLYSDYVISF